MTVKEVCGLIDKYDKCPNCGCETIGNGTGTIEVDTLGKEGYFKRTCPCGWSVIVKENDLKILRGE